MHCRLVPYSTLLENVPFILEHNLRGSPRYMPDASRGCLQDSGPLHLDQAMLRDALWTKSVLVILTNFGNTLLIV